MQAIVVTREGALFRADYPRPTAKRGEALIRVRLAGICATDLQVIAGYGSFEGVLGHEFVGEVVATDAGEWMGKRVVGGINIGCGDCDWCQQYIPEHCAARLAVGIRGHDGVFAEYVTLPLENLIMVPDNVPDELAVFTEPLAAVLRIGEQVAIVPGMRTAVIGPGRLGLLAAQVLAQQGTDVLVLGRRTATLERPRQLGLRSALGADAPDDYFDLVVDTSGNSGGLATAMRIVRSRGTVVLKSSQLTPDPINLNPLVVREIALVGSRCGPFAAALQMLADRHVHVGPMVDRRFPLQEAVAALQYAAMPGVCKVLLDLPGVDAAEQGRDDFA